MRQNNEKGTFEQMGKDLGESAGRMVGQAADVTLELIGSMVEGATSALDQWWASASAEQAGRSFAEEQDRACRQHFESTPRTGGARTYESTRPLYRFGHVAGQNPGYRGKSFREVEPELERAWGEDQSARHGAWPEVRGYVSFGYDRRTDTLRETREAGMRAQGGGSPDEHDIRTSAREES